MSNGREKLAWDGKIWERIDQAVHDECERTKIAKKFIPLHGPVASETAVPSDTINTASPALSVDEGARTPLIELWAEFTLTPQQVEREGELMTAVTLATRSANLLSQAEDVVIFQGQAAIDGVGGPKHPLFNGKKVQAKSGPAGVGLLNAALAVVNVPAIATATYGEKTFTAVASAYACLQSGGGGLKQAHYGPYTLVLRTEPYADTFAPLAATLIMPADRIKPLMTAGFYGTGALPDLTGILVSVGGNTMDLVVGTDTTTAFLQEDAEGRFRFRVFERFALRIKDRSSIIKLEFA